LPPLVAAKIVLLGDVPIRTILYAVLVVGTSDRFTHKELVPMSRLLAALASLVLMGFSLLFLHLDCASACSCAVFGSKKQVERALSHQGAVFSGKVVDLEKSSPPKKKKMIEGKMRTIIIMGGGTATATMRVSEVWKGPKQETLEVSTPASGMSCGYPFKEGQEYLVYAYSNQNLKVDLCSGTKPLSKAGADLTVLGDGEKPTVDGDALTDTSGGISVSAMVGLAGLVIVASLLVVVRLVRIG
jgi:hypothetical protein